MDPGGSWTKGPKDVERGARTAPPQELCRRGLGRDSESWGRWEAPGKDREKARFGRKSVSGGWKWEAGAERLGKRLPKVNDSSHGCLLRGDAGRCFRK